MCVLLLNAVYFRALWKHAWACAPAQQELWLPDSGLLLVVS